MMIAVLLQISKWLPCFTALRIPRGIDTRYVINVAQSPREMVTGIFSRIKSVTVAPRKKLLPKSSLA
ncbi:hypothetical protein D3C80_2057040 [compost metagenome]